MGVPRPIRIKGKHYDSLKQAALGEGVPIYILRKHIENGTLDDIKPVPKRKPLKFTVRGYEYTSYSDCAFHHQCGAGTVRRYVEAGRNDELPPRYVAGRDELYDKRRQEQIVNREYEKQRSRERGRKLQVKRLAK